MKNMTFKKFILTLLIIIMTLISVCFSGLLKRTEASAESKVAYNYLINFIKHNPDRTAGTEGGKNAANFIANYFVNLGLEKSGERFLSEVKYVDSNSKVITDYNVVGIKKGTSSHGKKVIIGAHYDNYTSTVYTEKGQGVYDNGTGGAAMLAIIDRIKNMDFEFDIEFVAFAAEEEGLYGSKEYLSALSDDEKNNILLYINLDSGAGGDYTYIYADEVGREQVRLSKMFII